MSVYICCISIIGVKTVTINLSKLVFEVLPEKRPSTVPYYNCTSVFTSESMEDDNWDLVVVTGNFIYTNRLTRAFHNTLVAII